MPDLLVVGGGPAGLLAAGTAALSGLSVLLLEKMPRCARKLRITGKGRCNLTSARPIDEFYSRFGREGFFLRDAFKAFDNIALRNFFEELGVPTAVERGERVFPESENAEDVVDALVAWALKSGVEISYDSPVRDLKLNEEKNAIEGIFLRSGKLLCAKHYLLACGGASYPLTGSDGDGARLAAEAGHTIIPLRPALIPLVVEGSTASRFQGVSLKNVTATILANSKKKSSLFGEMLFTHFGLSGPIILSLSKEVGDLLKQGKKVAISLDLKPALSEEQLELRLLREISNLGPKHIKALLKTLLPAKMLEGCLEDLNLPKDLPVSRITQKQREALRHWLKNLTFEIAATRPLEEAIVTAGGVKLKEVDPRTMRSKICQNLSLAGEILDLDACTGGYNLQEAFSTGYLAGLNVPKSPSQEKTI